MKTPKIVITVVPWNRYTEKLNGIREHPTLEAAIKAVQAVEPKTKLRPLFRQSEILFFDTKTNRAMASVCITIKP